MTTFNAADTVIFSDKHPQTVLNDLIQSASFELPLLPETTSKLLGICNEPDCPSCELADCIRTDQSIASHVLRMANSAMFCPGTPIVSLQQAVARLGMQRLREIVLVVTCKGRVFDVEGFDDEVRQSFRNSLTAAVFAQEIARARRLNVEDAFLCGLLHDIGRPVLLQAMVDHQNENHVLFDRGELLEAVDLDRVAVGSRLIEAWKLPQRIAVAVKHQRRDETLETTQETKLLRLAIAFTESFVDSEDFDPTELSGHPMVEQLNVYPDELTTIRNKSVETLDIMGNAI